MKRIGKGRITGRAGLLMALLLLFIAAPAAGSLSFVNMYQDGVNGVEGLEGARAVTLSPDGTRVYVASEYSNSVAVFERDPTTGLLTVVQVVQEGVDGVDGLVFASSIAISPDGAHAYVTAGDFQTTPGDRSVTLFECDQATGELTFVETVRREESGTLSVQVSPDGTRVYVAGDGVLSGDVAAIDVYSRNSTTGRLRLLQKVLDDENGVEGLGGLFDIALSPDGAHLYGASREDNALTVFRVEDDLCSGDANGDGQVTIDELVTAVNNALGGCPE